MSATRHTLAAPASFAREVRKSRFLAQAVAIGDDTAVEMALRALSDAAATHNCWAWRCGQHYRFSDDGEPAGTAGKPILQAIDGQAIDRTLVVVTRWFGGIKLGTGGLVRAYGGCAAECLRQARKTEVIDFVSAELAVDFAVVSTLRARLATLDANVGSEEFCAEGARLRVNVPAARWSELDALLADLTRGRGTLRRLET